MHLVPASALLLATFAALSAASPAVAPRTAPSSAQPTATLLPAQARQLTRLQRQHASLQSRQDVVVSKLESILSASAAVKSSLSSVSSAGAPLEAVATPYPNPSATPVLPPPSGCADDGQVAAPGPNGGGDPVCVDWCFPQDVAEGDPTFGWTTFLRPGSNAACRDNCKAAQDSVGGLAYYAVGAPFVYSGGVFGGVTLDGVECHCVTKKEMEGRAGLAGQERGCSLEVVGGSGTNASVAVFAIDPATA